MKCMLCSQAETTPGMTSVLLERGHLSLTVTGVPAQVCPRCGEAYADEDVAVQLLRQAEAMVSAGMKTGTLAFQPSGES